MGDGDELLDAFERSLGEFGDNEEGGRKISNRSHFLAVKSEQKYANAQIFCPLLMIFSDFTTSISHLMRF